MLLFLFFIICFTRSLETSPVQSYTRDGNPLDLSSCPALSRTKVINPSPNFLKDCINGSVTFDIKLCALYEEILKDVCLIIGQNRYQSLTLENFNNIENITNFDEAYSACEILQTFNPTDKKLKNALEGATCAQKCLGPNVHFIPICTYGAHLLKFIKSHPIVSNASAVNKPPKFQQLEGVVGKNATLGDSVTHNEKQINSIKKEEEKVSQSTAAKITDQSSSNGNISVNKTSEDSEGQVNSNVVSVNITKPLDKNRKLPESVKKEENSKIESVIQYLPTNNGNNPKNTSSDLIENLEGNVQKISGKYGEYITKTSQKPFHQITQSIKANHSFPENHGKLNENGVKNVTKVSSTTSSKPEKQNQLQDEKPEKQKQDLDEKSEKLYDTDDQSNALEDDDALNFENPVENSPKTNKNKVNPNFPFETDDEGENDDNSPVNNKTEKIEDGDSYFFTYFMIVCSIFIGGYVVYHNKQKILALVLEGRRGRRNVRSRRPNSANYKKLDSNLEEAISSTCDKSTAHVIY